MAVVSDGGNVIDHGFNGGATTITKSGGRDFHGGVYYSIRDGSMNANDWQNNGPAEIIGPNPFALVGGTGAVWLRTKEQAGRVRLTAVHPTLGKREVDFEIAPAAPEAA